MKRTSNPSHARGQRGMSLIELMLALFVLAVGLAGAMILVSTAIASNNRNKLDTTATLLSQMVLEKIITPGNSLAGAPPHFVTITDCTKAPFQIWLDPNVASPPFKPNLPNGDYNWGAGAPAVGYSMNYSVCRAGGQIAVYDVRWNIQALTYAGVCPGPNCGTVYTKEITVSARPLGAATANSTQVLFFGYPITLHGVSAVSPN